MEWLEWRDSLCPGCHAPKSETMDRANQERYDAVAVRCFRCQAKDTEARKWAKDDNSDSAGLLIAVVETE